ncbi:MAG: metallophosphoesterase [Bacteroidales bacterium]|nr:metallophosphoesterase [Bacteroidales bacterium]
MKRREFLKNAAVLAAAAGSADLLAASKTAETTAKKASEAPQTDGKLIVSAPMLQNYAEKSMGVAFAVSALANGYVIYGKKPDLSDGRKVKCGGFRATTIHDEVMHVRLKGLEPATKYYYKIGADRIDYQDGYHMYVVGNEEDPQIYSFTTAGKGAKAHFCVINDTHKFWHSFAKITEKIASLAPSCVVWNGDANNREETLPDLVETFLVPNIPMKDYAARTPFLFAPGNHDQRGFAGRRMENIWMFRQPDERASRDWDLGRNFAVRMGDVALIGLDTGEDKLDGNPLFAGLFNNEAYREAQVEWLKDALASKEIAEAPFLVAFCHIPLFDPRPDANPGDLYPADVAPGFKRDYAAWQRACSKLWGPLLDEAGCQLLIVGHQHGFRYDAPSKGRGWAQIVGGAPDNTKERYSTVIEGLVERGELKINVHNLFTGKVEASFSFKSR